MTAALTPERRAELLPCPFCGGPPVLRAPDNDCAWNFVCCETEGCPAHPAARGDDADDAVRQWNRRATEPTDDAEVALCIGKLRSLVRWADDRSLDAANAITNAAALIERLARERPAWRTIESAPTGDELFLIVGSGRVMVVRGDILATSRKDNIPKHLSMRWPTHWMPLPEGPKP